jgi:RNA-binding protein
MEQITLNSKQRRYLKGLAHGDRVPACQVGKAGLTEPVKASINTALRDHELIKVQFIDKELIDRHEMAGGVAEALGAHLVQLIGFKAVLYRRNPEKPRIVLPQ